MHLMEVVSELGIPKSERDTVRDVLDELTGLGMAMEMPGNRFRITPRKKRRTSKSVGDAPAKKEEKKRVKAAPSAAAEEAPEDAGLTGWLTVHPRGFGFVSVDGPGDDVFVPGSKLGPALHGDRVRVTAQRSAKGRDGEVVEVIRRGTGRVAGTLRTKRKQAWIEPSDPRVPSRVEVVGTPPLGLKDGDEVVAQIAKWPTYDGDVMEARVLSGLGPKGSATVEVEKIKIREGVEEELPEDAVLEAQSFGTKVRERDLKGREDLRHLELTTIDPPTARDHDDAVWAERLKDGSFRVVVAIADVAHYVQENSALDRAALDRATSIYLPDRVIPMLPHELSSNLASLVPDEDRLCMAVEVEVGPRGALKNQRFIEGVMRSRARISYGGVARALGLSDEPEREPEAEQRRETLQVLWDVSQILRKKRRRRGSLDFDLPEAEIVLGDDGEPIDIRRSRVDPGLRKAYGLIEDLMLLANEVVATDLSRRSMPTIYRVHGPPDEQKVEIFAALAESLGYPFEPESKGFAKFLRKVEGTGHAQALSFLLLRAMQQATYTTENIGHFALASKHYLHFTSPIRRYPDLAVHRIVKKIIHDDRVKKRELSDRLAAQAKQCSRLERRALTIDREATDVYRAILVKDRVGEEFEAQVTGVADHGAYVAFDDPFVEARIPIETLGDDWYERDSMGLRLVGSRSGHSIGLGDRVTVRLENVSVENRELTASLIGELHEQLDARPPEKGRGRGRNEKTSKSRGGKPSQRRDDRRGGSRNRGSKKSPSRGGSGQRGGGKNTSKKRGGGGKRR